MASKPYRTTVFSNIGIFPFKEKERKEKKKESKI
jgi:hypothetical protein